MNASHLSRRTVSVMPFAFLIAAVGALNFCLPRTYLLFAIDHASFLPRAFVVLWTASALLLLLAAARQPPRRKVATALTAILFILLCASLLIFRTQYPGLQGDGEAGGYPPMHSSARVIDYPDIRGRFPCFLTDGLKFITRERLILDFQFSSLLHQDVVTQSASMAVMMLTGAAMASLVAFWTRRRFCSASRIGLQLLFLTSPAMLGAYGHFDSYVVPAFLVVAWLIALRAVLRHPRAWQPYMGLALSLVIAIWAHPLLGVLTGLSAMLGGWFLWRWLCTRYGLCRTPPWRLFIAPPALLVIIVGLWAGAMPSLKLSGGPEFLYAELSAIRWLLLHEKLFSTLQAALPGYVLLAAVWWCARTRQAGLSPLQVLAIFGCAFVTSLMLTLRLGYGIKDELLYTMLGQVLLCLAVLLALATRVDRRALLYAGIFSAFLFVPRVYLNATHLLCERYIAYLPRDPSWANREISPYWLLAQCQPLDTEADRQSRLAILEHGFRDPLPMWSAEEYRARSLALYAAWCCAFGEKARGLSALRALGDVSPKFLKDTWTAPGFFGTDRYDPRAPWTARAWSAEFMMERARTGAGDTNLTRELGRALNEVSRAQRMVLLLPGGGQDTVVNARYNAGFEAGATLRQADLAKGTLGDRAAIIRHADIERRRLNFDADSRTHFLAWRLGLLDGYLDEASLLSIDIR